MVDHKDLYLENRRLNQEERGQKRAKLVSKPRRLMAILTRRCNISCIMCLERRRDNNFILPKRVIRDIIGFFPYLESVAWQGGEVFLLDYFRELFQEAARYPQLVQEINTNGILFDEAWVDTIKGTNTKLIFSIDSTDKKTYEYIRKGAKFEKLLENINLINAMTKNNGSLNVDKIINIVIMRSNYRTLESFINFALKYNFSGLNFLNLNIDSGCPQEDIFSPPDIDALGYLKSTFPSMMKKAESCGIYVTSNILPFLHDNYNFNSLCESSNRDGLFCAMPWKSLCIDASRYGEVFPECLCYMSVGNICKNSMDEIWNSMAMQTYRNRIAAGDLENWCSPNCIKGIADKGYLQAI